ncbi:MAG: TlyA family RNA methyltransferase [Negativicutes bacterium]|jgi:23S rRNA (cytidine1920-2'-O)/16S rRNA (cytidine1409-2'-O)-methyltransferase
MAKKRLDVLLVERNFAASRERANSMILAGKVRVNSQMSGKAGVKIDENAIIEVLTNDLCYVSRGGLKLEKAMAKFAIVFKDKVVADIGASTGGFTDCALQNGARFVYAIDVGYGQLAWKLRNDDRVINMERTNIRNVNADVFQPKADIVTIDVSFISLSKVLFSAVALATDYADFIVLIKPQFEAGRERVGKKGVVRDKNTHVDVIQSVVNSGHENGLFIKALTFSPVTGPEGNIEFLAHFVKVNEELCAGAIEEIVEAAHKELD